MTSLLEKARALQLEPPKIFKSNISRLLSDMYVSSYFTLTSEETIQRADKFIRAFPEGLLDGVTCKISESSVDFIWSIGVKVNIGESSIDSVEYKTLKSTRVIHLFLGDRCQLSRITIEILNGQIPKVINTYR